MGQGRAGEALALIDAGLPVDATSLEREYALLPHDGLVEGLDADALVRYLGGLPRTADLAAPLIERQAAAGDHDAALGVYAGAVEHAATQGDAWYLPHVPDSLLHARAAEIERAVRDAETRHDIGNDEILGDLGDVYMRLGRHEDALRLYRRANRIDPGDSEWTDSIREAMEALGG